MLIRHQGKDAQHDQIVALPNKCHVTLYTMILFNNSEDNIFLYVKYEDVKRYRIC